MTKDEILAINPGRELDALVAEKVMNLCVIDFIQGYGDGCVVSDKGMDEWKEHLMYGKMEDPDSLEPYSTDISAAWVVIKKFKDYGILFTPTRGHYCFIQTEKERYQSPSCESASEAIVKAALLAVLENNNDQ